MVAEIVPSTLFCMTNIMVIAVAITTAYKNCHCMYSDVLDGKIRTHQI